MELNWNHAINTLNNSKIEPIQTKKRQKMLTQTIEQINLKFKKNWNEQNEFSLSLKTSGP